MLEVKNLSGGYDGNDIVKSVSFTVDKGEVLGILGPNGSGKSTLLKLISQILSPSTGEVRIDGKPATSYSSKAFARIVAVLPQLHAHAFSHTVKETVDLGRYPHQKGMFSTWSVQDEQAVQAAMTSTGVTEYADTSIELLSGGEQQRVFVAQALAQEAPILLLDEPTNHLDIAYQQQLLDMIRKEAVEQDMTVISVFHDINLASLYCDRLVLMNEGQIELIGKPQDVVQAQSIDRVYKARVKAQPHPEAPKPQITLMPQLTELTGPSTIQAEAFSVTSEQVLFESTAPLKTLSSAVHNAGMGWYRLFLNRHVDKAYHAPDVEAEMTSYLQRHHLSLTETVGMMTAAKTENVALRTYETDFGRLTVAVTAGLGNATDIAEVYKRQDDVSVGTVNTWVFIDGYLSDQAFIQGIVTATEAKVKAFQTEQIKDPISGTIATGTSTDSVLIAATQHGERQSYAGPITPLGKAIAQAVYECTVAAIQTYKQERASDGQA